MGRLIDWFFDSPLGWMMVVVLILTVLIWGAVEEEKTWEHYSAIHHCVQTGRVESSTSTIVDSKGNVNTLFTPEKKIYRCDGNEERIR